MASETQQEDQRQDSTSNKGNDEDAVLQVQNLTKIYPDGTLAVDDISFTVDRGDFCVVIGPSGCGKSTTLHSIVGKVEPSEGKIILGGEDITNEPTYKRDISLVFQDFQLFPHLDVEENIRYGPETADINKSDEEIDSLLSLLDISTLRNSSIDELSAGQKQRVALARSLVLEPDLLLLDEPLGDMDYKLQKRMERELLRIHRETDTTMVYVTHDQTQAMRLADQIVVLNDGKIEQSGSVDDVYNSPATAFVSTFVGDSNIFNGKITAVSDEGREASVETDFGTFQISTDNLRSDPEELIEDEIPFSIRPHNINLSSSAENTIDCSVDDIIQRPDTGTQVILTANNENDQKELQATAWENIDIDSDSLTISWSAEDAVLLEQLSVLSTIDLGEDILGE